MNEFNRPVRIEAIRELLSVAIQGQFARWPAGLLDVCLGTHNSVHTSCRRRRAELASIRRAG